MTIPLKSSISVCLTCTKKDKLSKPHVVHLATQRQRWLLERGITACNLIYGQVALYFMQWSLAICHLKIPRPAIYTRKSCLLIIRCLNFWVVSARISSLRFLIQTLLIASLFKIFVHILTWKLISIEKDSTRLEIMGSIQVCKKCLGTRTSYLN